MFGVQKQCLCCFLLTGNTESIYRPFCGHPARTHEYRKMFESRISAGTIQKLLGCAKSHAKTVASSHDMESHAKKCVERYSELANKTIQQLYKVSTQCLDDHHFRKEALQTIGDLPNICSRIVLKCFFLARIGGTDILWSVNKLAQAVEKWTRACDRRLAS